MPPQIWGLLGPFLVQLAAATKNVDATQDTLPLLLSLHKPLIIHLLMDCNGVSSSPQSGSGMPDEIMLFGCQMKR